MIPRLQYFLRRALKGMRQGVFVNAVAVVTIAIALFVVAVFGGVVSQTRGLIEAWTGDLVVTVYFSPDATEDQRLLVQERVLRLAPGAELEVVSPDQALTRLRDSLAEHARVLEGLEENPLPASLELRGGFDREEAGAIGAFADELKGLKGVDEVDYGREWAARLESLLRFVTLMGGVLGGLILLAAAVTVSNTIKLAVFARRDEIEIMKLCGATDAFVRAPFLIEGLLQGVMGALVASALGALLWVFALPGLREVLVSAFAVQVEVSAPVGIVGWLLLGGAALGLGGSALSLGRFLRV